MRVDIASNGKAAALANFLLSFHSEKCIFRALEIPHVASSKLSDVQNDHRRRFPHVDDGRDLDRFGLLRVVEPEVSGNGGPEKSRLGLRDYLLANRWALALFGILFVQRRLGGGASSRLPLAIQEKNHRFDQHFSTLTHSGYEFLPHCKNWGGFVRCCDSIASPR